MTEQEMGWASTAFHEWLWQMQITQNKEVTMCVEVLHYLFKVFQEDLEHVEQEEVEDASCPYDYRVTTSRRFRR